MDAYARLAIPPDRRTASARWRRGTLLATTAACLLLGGCGGGGGSRIGSTPPPVVAAPTPAPSTPTPSPTPAAVFNTAEYARSSGLAQANAVPAYQAGATGAGITVGVIDSGIDERSAEFAGRISPASADIVASRGLQDEGGHGTAVSSVILAARNGSGTHGVAFDSTLLVLRTDSVGSCGTTGEDSGCRHSDIAMARALDRAVSSGARVVNISLGGSPGGSAFRSAIGRATGAGLVVVISAGNDGLADPDALALIANDAVARGQVIIAGAVGAGGTIAGFSNRAGSGANHYLTARGERVLAPDHNGTLLSWDGTSFSAPHISGALALLAQAFPNLTGRQLVDLLYSAATDLGAAGVDPVYGRGLLNIGRAFQPIGAMQLAGGGAGVAPDSNGMLSTPMGDARGASLATVVLDRFERAFAIDPGETVGIARPAGVLAGALQPDSHGLVATGSAATVALQIQGTPRGATVDPLTLGDADALRARATAGYVAGRISRSTAVALGIAHGAAVLAGRLDPVATSAFLVARDGSRGLGFDRLPGAAAAVRHDAGRTAWWASAEEGAALTRQTAGYEALRGAFATHRYAVMGGGVDRRLGDARAGIALSHLAETESVLGARFGPLFGAAGARSWFVDAGLDLPLPFDLTASLGVRRGWTRVEAGGARAGASLLHSDAWRVDMAGSTLLLPGDRLALRLSQPLRVAGGGFALSLPDGWDYATRTATRRAVFYDLAPSGREIVGEVAYGLPTRWGRVDANLYWRRDPGNIAGFPDDRGAALRLAAAF